MLAERVRRRHVGPREAWQAQLELGQDGHVLPVHGAGSGLGHVDDGVAEARGQTGELGSSLRLVQGSVVVGRGRRLQIDWIGT